VLLTLDRRDFQMLFGKNVYGLRIDTPDEFLRTEREAGRIDSKSEAAHASRRLTRERNSRF